MPQKRLTQTTFLAGMMVALLLLLPNLLIAPVSRAQGIFATNTPVPGQVEIQEIVPTATPIPQTDTTDAPTVDTEVSLSTQGPTTIMDRYALRQWFERDLVALVRVQINALREGDADARRALQLTLFELEERFPGAPRDLSNRLSLIEAFLAAPRGTIDARTLVRPYIEAQINANPGQSSYEIAGFEVVLRPANLTSTISADTVLEIAYTHESGVVLYQDVVLALRDDDQTITIIETTYDLTAAPFIDLETVRLDRIADVNRDGIDEVVVVAQDSQVNDRMLILAVRNGLAVNLVQPGSEIRFANVVSWPYAAQENPGTVLSLRQLNEESTAPDWECLSERTVTWDFERNLYRETTDDRVEFADQDSLACTLLRAEPLFAIPPTEAIATVEDALLEYSFEATSANRALMTLAMLYVLQGRLDTARATAELVQPEGDSDSWQARQSAALLRALGSSGNTALDICAALAIAGEDPACDMNALLGRNLRDLTLSTDEDLVAQLEANGLQVLERVTVSQVGFANREAISFFYPDTEFWAFVAQRDGTYAVEPAETPAGFEEAVLPQAQLEAPDSAFAALLVDNNPTQTLAILRNLQQSNPDLPLRPAGEYLQALAYDLAGDRANARRTYFNTWERYSSSIWGFVASQHLELR